MESHHGSSSTDSNSNDYSNFYINIEPQTKLNYREQRRNDQTQQNDAINNKPTSDARDAGLETGLAGSVYSTGNG